MSDDEGRAGPIQARFEPEDLDGHTIDELVDYLDSGRDPVDPSIEQSAGCRIALEALERLQGLGPALLAQDTADEPAVDDDWVMRIMAGIARDARAGRRIPIALDDEADEVVGTRAESTDAGDPAVAGLDAAEDDDLTDDLGMTEGSVRGLIRGAESAVPGVLVGRCRLDGEVGEIGAPVRVTVEVSVPYGTRIPDLLDELRQEIARRLAQHTELVVDGIDLVVHDVRHGHAEGGTRR
ncbi:hypothetical protein [uncultured Microbacterium sp.]|uniref:hypothetical protein n=1 Tax=uncultured Microbacterium sp. TaxID=191216 RepID=UPI0025E0BA7C|nr:hypothetical protein [uncultured Microbacterium sp.]